MSRLFGTDGVRGVANEELTPLLAMQLGQAGAYVLTKETNHKPTIMVGCDTRISGDMLLDLIDAATHHLSPEEAMNFTFCTYCTTSSINSSFALRAYPEGSPQAINAERLSSGNFIRLGRHIPLPAGWQPPAPPASGRRSR